MDKALSLIQNSGGVVATRFHSMILSWFFCKNTYTLVYKDKTLNVINDNNFKGQHTKIKDISNLEATEVYEQITTATQDNIDKEKLKAREQFSVLDEFLIKFSKTYKNCEHVV